MAIKIEIIKTLRGWNYRNSESRILVGTINKCENKPGIFVWETFGEWTFTTEEKAHEQLKFELIKRASKLGENIKFTNI